MQDVKTKLIPGKLYKMNKNVVSYTFLEWHPYKNILSGNKSNGQRIDHFLYRNDIFMFISYVSSNDFFKLKLYEHGYPNCNIPIIWSCKHNKILIQETTHELLCEPLT